MWGKRVRYEKKKKKLNSIADIKQHINPRLSAAIYFSFYPTFLLQFHLPFTHQQQPNLLIILPTPLL